MLSFGKSFVDRTSTPLKQQTNMLSNLYYRKETNDFFISEGHWWFHDLEHYQENVFSSTSWIWVLCESKTPSMTEFDVTTSNFPLWRKKRHLSFKSVWSGTAKRITSSSILYYRSMSLLCTSCLKVDKVAKTNNAIVMYEYTSTSSSDISGAEKTRLDKSTMIDTNVHLFRLA